jgi:hypothetical protein
MAHFAQLDENNVVMQVIVVHNNELIDGTDENEAKGVAFCQSLFGAGTRWVQTSYNGNFRKNYAGMGFFYDAARDAFIAPKPELNPSFVLDEQTAQWVPPEPKPNDGKNYTWVEKELKWVETPDRVPALNEG